MLLKYFECYIPHRWRNGERARIESGRSWVVGVMVSVLASRVVDRGFERRSVHTKDYKIGISCFSAKHATLRSKSKYWLDRNQNTVSKWSDKFTRVLLFR